MRRDGQCKNDTLHEITMCLRVQNSLYCTKGKWEKSRGKYMYFRRRQAYKKMSYILIILGNLSRTKCPRLLYRIKHGLEKV